MSARPRRCASAVHVSGGDPQGLARAGQATATRQVPAARPRMRSDPSWTAAWSSDPDAARLPCPRRGTGGRDRARPCRRTAPRTRPPVGCRRLCKIWGRACARAPPPVDERRPLPAARRVAPGAVTAALRPAGPPTRYHGHLPRHDPLRPGDARCLGGRVGCPGGFGQPLGAASRRRRRAAAHTDGGLAHTDDGVAHTDGGVAHTDGGVAHTDGGVAHSDGGAAHSDGGAAHSDGSVAHSKGGAANSKGGVTHTDGGGNRLCLERQWRGGHPHAAPRLRLGAPRLRLGACPL